MNEIVWPINIQGHFGLIMVKCISEEILLENFQENTILIKGRYDQWSQKISAVQPFKSNTAHIMLTWNRNVLYKLKIFNFHEIAVYLCSYLCNYLCLLMFMKLPMVMKLLLFLFINIHKIIFMSMNFQWDEYLIQFIHKCWKTQKRWYECKIWLF